MKKFLKSRGYYLEITQTDSDIPAVNWDYEFVEFYRKACAQSELTSAEEKKDILFALENGEALRDYYTGAIGEIKHLVQLDSTPNLELKEPKWELYKISVSFPFVRK